MFFRRRPRCWSWIGAFAAISTTIMVIIVGSSTGASAARSSSSSSSSSSRSSSSGNHSTSSVICTGTPEYIGDGECDDINNIEACGYDGGDCCSCTCTDTDGNNPCSDGGFNCLDPTAACQGEEDDGDWTESGDGLSSSSSSSSSGQDTTAADDGDVPDDDGDGELGDSSPYSVPPGAGLSSCSSSWTGDGFCDEINNTEECSYDGGDCCACTCLTGEYDCTSIFNCVDPAATVDCTPKDGTSSPSPSSGGDSSGVAVSSGAASNKGGKDEDGEGAVSPCSESLVGDGSCDGANNNAECGYDGGDCCSGQNCDLCIDPAASCSDSSSEDEKNNKTKNTNKNAKIVVGVGVGGVGLWSVGLLAIRYRRLAREKKASEAASSAHAHQRGIAGPGGGSRAIR